MQRDIDADTTGQYSHLSGVPKPLLPVAGTPLVSHWISALEELSRHEIEQPVLVDEVVVVVNATNQSQFENWRAGLTTSLKVTLVCDGATSNETRPGAITCMALGVGEDLTSDVLFIGGFVNLFHAFMYQFFFFSSLNFIHLFTRSSFIHPSIHSFIHSLIHSLRAKRGVKFFLI